MAKERDADVCPQCGSHYTERESGEDTVNGVFIGVWFHCYACGHDFYVEIQHDHDDDETADIAAWARPAYASAYSDYLLSGAQYGHTDEGMRRWMSEQIEQQRRAAKKARRR